MTNDQITQWALEAGIYLDGENQRKPLYVSTKEELQAFATLVRNATLEEAAVKCDEQADRAKTSTGSARADACADKIRSMKS